MENELELKTQKEGDALTIFLIGEVNTGTAPQLKEIVDACKVDLSREEWYRLYLASGKFLP